MDTLVVQTGGWSQGQQPYPKKTSCSEMTTFGLGRISRNYTQDLLNALAIQNMERQNFSIASKNEYSY